jgi:hypothetical protein
MKTENIEIHLREIAGFVAAFEALRLPFGKECRSKTTGRSSFCDAKDDPTKGIGYTHAVKFDDEGKDLKLMSTLVKRGDEHSKAVRAIVVYVEINAPRYWWQEMDTYRVGTDRLSSESTMHIQGKGMSTEELVKMKSELTEGTMQKRMQMFSYQTLQRIWVQRHNHRLPHWREFCKWIESLPLAEQLILVGLKDEENE